MNNEIIRLLNDVAEDSIESPYEFEGKSVPRVTEIISSCIHSEALMQWANSLGFKSKSYVKTMKMYTDIGTECHENIDEFISNDCKPGYNFIGKMYESENAFNAYLKWWNDINSNGNIVEILMHEQTIVCKYFGGTLDGLYKINGKVYLVDYKTSNKITYRYCLQLAAYRYMLREVYNIELDGAIVLKLSKNAEVYNEHLLDFNNVDHLNYINQCEDAFLSLVYAYYNIKNIEAKFKDIGWE